MTKQYDIWVDGGVSTGIALVSYSDTEPLKVEQVWQVENGVRGFLDWWADHFYEGDIDYGYEPELLVPEIEHRIHIDSVEFFSEKFTPRQSLTLAASTPLLVEGAMVGLGLIPTYEEDPTRYGHPSQQYFTGGTSLADKKKRSNAWLKASGFYFTGKDVGQKDADDARSAVRHAIAHRRREKHLPTLKAYFDDV